jgi:hypothetical protein
MPFARYMPEHMGSATISPSGDFEAGSFAELTLTYTAGTFGIDDTGMLKISWRTTSDMGKPQLTDPVAANYTTVEASNGAELEVRVDRVNIRPWANTLVIRVGRGFLREGDTITVRFGDRRHGSPGLRLQTNCEPTFEFKTVVDAFAAYEFTEIPSPEIALVPGRAANWKAILPTLAVVGESFRLAILAEDRWGNPTTQAEGELLLASSVPIAGMPTRVRIKRGDGPVVLEGLRAERPGDVVLRVRDSEERELCAANPLRIVAAAALRHYWGDLHGQSEETIGTNTVGSYFAYARDRAFLDIVGHQGNDFQISDGFWDGLNAVTKHYDEPGRFVAVPGYEWSGNTGMGGDRNVFFMNEARPIQRSSSILVGDGVLKQSDRHTAAALFAALQGEDVVVTAHVGGRYADLHAAHDGRIETAVEVHSTWGTFEWLLHDAFDIGARVGVTSHSDDHKGRPGATRPGASHFGAIGGLTCYLMPELTRAALFDALRRRRHYGTTGMRMFLSVAGHFAHPVTLFDQDPALGPATTRAVTEIGMGDIVQPGAQAMRLEVEAVGAAPIERIDVFHGKEKVHTVRGPENSPPGRRIRVLWQGAEYRGRGREVDWRGALTIENGKFLRAEPVNFLNPENPLREIEPGKRLAWRSVTTGNMAGIDLWLADGMSEQIVVETNHGGGKFAASEIGRDDIVIPAGGLGRQISLYRLPEKLPDRLTLSHEVDFTGPRDLPVYVRVTQEDGNQAWSSPIYLIDAPK